MKAIAQRMSSGATTTLKDMPSFAEVMGQADLKFKVVSLMSGPFDEEAALQGESTFAEYFDDRT